MAVGTPPLGDIDAENVLSLRLLLGPSLPPRKRGVTPLVILDKMR